jgi:hypothetical protein
MTLPLGVAGLCLTISIGIGAIVWMTVVRLRDQHDASEVIPLEVAVCIRRENGDVIIRQRRGKGVLGLLIGFLLLLGGLAVLVAQVSNTTGLGLEALCAGPGLLILGALVAWVSARGFREPDVAIKAASQTVEIHRGLLGGTQTWPFDAIRGVVRQSRVREDILLNIAETLIAPQQTSSSTNRTIIGLQHSDGREVRICTATKEAARRVPTMVAAALGKPVLTK